MGFEITLPIFSSINSYKREVLVLVDHQTLEEMLVSLDSAVWYVQI